MRHALCTERCAEDCEPRAVGTSRAEDEESGEPPTYKRLRRRATRRQQEPLTSSRRRARCNATRDAMDERSAVCENPATEFATALLTQEQIFSGAAQRLAHQLRGPAPPAVRPAATKLRRSEARCHDRSCVLGRVSCMRLLGGVSTSTMHGKPGADALKGGAVPHDQMPSDHQSRCLRSHLERSSHPAGRPEDPGLS
jgi:hypothetical protein